MKRATLRTKEAEATILAGIRNGRSLITICDNKKLPSQATVFEWLASDEARRAAGQVPEGEVTFLDRYRIATRIRADVMQEEILAVSDDGRNDTYVDKDGVTKTDYDNIQRAKLRVDSRKWLMSKLDPKRWGDKTAEVSVETHVHNNHISVEEQKRLQARHAAAMARINPGNGNAR